MLRWTTSTIPELAEPCRAYSAGLIWPRPCPARCAARATMPENSGEASLVPPKMWKPGFTNE